MVDTSFWILFPWTVLAAGMAWFFWRKRTSIAEVQQDSAKKLYGRELPDSLTNGGAWFNVVIASGMAVLGVVSTIVILVS